MHKGIKQLSSQEEVDFNMATYYGLIVALNS
jgi:hypothetical protein